MKGRNQVQNSSSYLILMTFFLCSFVNTVRAFLFGDATKAFIGTQMQHTFIVMYHI
jgi:hypothetical protein